MATASTDNNRRPHPTITYPSVHLDSFSPDRFNTGAFPSPNKSTSTAPQAGPSRLPLSRQIGEAGARDETGAGGLQPTNFTSPAFMSQQQRPSSSGSGSGSSSGRARLAVQQQQQYADGVTAASGSGSAPSYGISSTPMLKISSSSSAPLTRAPPPTLPPPNLGLPPLPSLSPISPVYDIPADGTSQPNTIESPFSATPISSPAGPRPQSTKLGPSLSIHIPKSPQQSRSVPSLKDSPGIPRRRTIVENEGHQGVYLDVESSRNHSKEIPRRLEKKASTNDLKQQQPSSPPSPSARRLPRPPGEIAMPTASTTWPVPTTPKPFVPQHQPQKSASILPVVGGLADAGPYPSTTTPKQQAAAVPSTGIGMGRPPAVKPIVTKPQEEICLECMMRDRDLADVTVTGPGAWARQSDADWDELRWREEALLKSMGSQSSLSIPSLEDGGVSSDSEDTSVSLPSTGNSAEDSENRRRLAAKKQQRSTMRARRREADGRVAKEVGWRGFKWEEGKQGEGMPRGFRGTVGGRLTEGGIKAVMTRYPKASEHRYEYLHKYLAHQWKLVIDIRSEAQRRGGFAIPGELAYNDSVSSHEPIAAGPRTSSISWDQRSALELRETIREPLVPATVRPSPSTPTELAALRPKPPAVIIPRPHTQLLPETAGERFTPTPHSARNRYEKGISSPGTLERSPQPDRYTDDDDALWSPVSAGDGSLRPFSFAVRAGAAAARDGGEGGGGIKGRLRRFGGSVTSFFDGSHNGSGSMMDMHLGLDHDRRNAPSHQIHHNYSRAVSMASPSRPSFFGNSRTSVDQSRDPRALSKSISSSRLSQVVRSDDEAPKKKKGIKGLIQKMKPKAKRQSSSSMPPVDHQRQYRQTQTPDQGDIGTPLAPPPNMAYLAGQGQQRHNRNGSSSSMADSQGSSWKMRSVSAPIGGSSSGSLSASPTSSKFRRESYNSGQQRRPSGDYDGDLQRGSIVEVLNGAGAGVGAGGGGQQYQGGLYPRASYASPDQPHAQLYDEQRGPYIAQAQAQAQAYPHPSFRGSRHTAGSISNSSGIAPTIETPPMPLNQTPFFSRPPSISSPATATSNNFASPNPNVNRFKNLPPLPSADTERERIASSPESFQVVDSPDFTRSPQKSYAAYQHQQQQTPPPRVSYDRPTSTPRAEASPRMAHSMYVQPTVSGSTGSFPRFAGMGVGGSPYRPPSHNEMYGQPPYPGSPGDLGPGGHGGHGRRANGFVEQDKRSLMSKKGIKGFFGGAKGGRMA